MPRIPIVSQTQPTVPKNKDLSSTRPRFTPPGGKPPLPLQESYNRQGNDASKANKKNVG